MRTWNLTSLLGRIVGGVALVCAGSTAMADSISANGTITNVSADTGLAPGSFVLSAAAPVLTIPSGDFGGSGYRAGGTPSVLEFRVAPGFRFNAAALPILTPDDPELTFGAPVFVNDGLVTVTVTGVPNPATDVNVTITNFDVGIDPGSPNAVAVANAASGLFPVELSRPFLAGPPPALVLFQLDTVAGIIPTDNSTLTAGAGDLVALANSADPIRVVFTARDFGNNLIPNTNLAVDILSNNAGLAPLPAQITVNPAVGARVTNGSGQIDFVLTASSAVPTTALAAQFPLSAVSGPSISFTAVPVLDISILGSGTAVANNTDSVVVQVRARDAGNISLPNLPVTLLLDTLAALSTINVNGAAAPIVTNANGLATFSLTSDVAAAAFSVTAQTPSPTEADPALVADSPDAGPIQFTAASLGFVVTSVTPSPLVSGAPFTLNFSIRDEGGTGELTAVTGANLDIAVKGGNGQLIGNCVGCTGFNGSSGSITGFAYVTDVVPESNVQIAIVSTNQSIGSASSANLTVNPAAGRSLQFDTQPQSVTGTAPINPTPITVSLRDGGGSVVTNEPGVVSLELRRNGAIAPGLSGIVVSALSSGVATFASNLTVSERNLGYSLRASTIGATGDSATFSTAGFVAFDITSVAPSPLLAGQPFTLNFEVRDDGGTGALIDVSNVNLEVAVKLGNGTLTGACVGCTAFNGSAGSITGLAYETGLVPEAGVQLVLVSTNESIGAACSDDLTINPNFGVGTEPRIIFATQPLPLVQVNGPLAAAGQPIRLAIVDLDNRRVTSFDGQNVSISLQPNDAALVAPTGRDRQILNGEVAYADLAINAVANGFSLRAVAPVGVNPNIVDSTLFDVLPGLDLQATGILLESDADGALSNVRVQYSVVGSSVGAFNIQIGYDVDGNGVLDAGESAGFEAIPPTTPGSFELNVTAGNLSNLRTLMDGTIADGRNVFVVIDPANAVPGEADEVVNNVARRAVSVDIIAESAVLVGTNLRVIYRVSALASVPPFNITATRDPAPALLMADQAIDVAGRTPGRRVVDIPLALPPGTFVRNADNIIASVNAQVPPVGESTAANNLAFSSPLFVDVNIRDVRVDPVAVGGSACPNSLRATVRYSVESPFAVEPFSISLSSNGAALAIAPFVGDVTPGQHEASARVDEQVVSLGQGDGRDLTIQAATVISDNDGPNNSRNSNAATFGTDVDILSFAFTGQRIGERIPSVKVPVLVSGTRVPTTFSIRLIAETVRVDGSVRTTFTKNLGPGGSVLVRSETVNCPTSNENPIEIDFGSVTVERDAIFTGDSYALRAELDPDFANNVDFNAANDSRVTQNVIGAGDRDDDGDRLTAAEESAGTDQVFVRSANADASVSRGFAQVPSARTITSDALGSIDTDGDGFADFDERRRPVRRTKFSSDADRVFTNPGEDDSDGDGLGDQVEVLEHGTDPTNWDSDGDLLSDLEEINGFRISNYSGRSSGLFDPEQTLIVSTNPLVPDTDNDGVNDWAEINTWARSNADLDGDGDPDVVQSIGLDDIAARRDSDGSFSGVSGKSLRGVRTDPTSSDTDRDGLPDATDPAPQIDPANWGFDQNSDGVFDLADITALRNAATDAGGNAAEVPATVEAFQRALLNFDLDGDGFLEAPDTNADGFPDFTRYNEATLEQLFGIDFSNDGSLDDGFDVGDPAVGSEGPNETREQAFNFGRILFGAFRVQSGGSGTLEVNERLTSGVSQLFATDNCPTQANTQQLDFDADGLGDDCDNDRDNDGVENRLDPTDQNPTLDGGGLGAAGICGFGAVQAMALSMLGLALVRGGRAVSGRRLTR